LLGKVVKPYKKDELVTITPIKTKSHGRKAKNTFRYEFDEF